MRILLAPMEGVVDAEMRAVLTDIGGYDRCVTEFVRVTEQVLPDKVFYRYSPELLQGGTTPSGVPVFVQLLGGNHRYMALNARRLQRLAPPGIDLNFGCPSKTVNRSDGGSSLLKEPQRVGDIVSAVRDAVDPAIPVTVKIRLGFSNDDLLEEIAERTVKAGAQELCIHARTRDQRYKPPAHWKKVAKISNSLAIPMIINGEIWSTSDARHALLQSGCKDIMLGRGALTTPDLAVAIQAELNNDDCLRMTWRNVVSMMMRYLQSTENKHTLFVSNRAKQWLAFLQVRFPEAKTLFHIIKRMRMADEVLEAIERHVLENSPTQ